MPKLSRDDVEKLTALAIDLARNGETTELLEFFDHGLPLNVQDAGGNTALMMAAYHGHADAVRGLIERGADIDLRNARDQSPIAGAIFKGEDEIVRMLLAAGADLDAGTPPARLVAEMFGKKHLLAPDAE
ncbi:ankyrin repeat domain-containing protein [Paramicrobacterium fandaimingii]|uniref:ankyrin repeat domain-containing protein n=1 Tax=Paramicrobacterium fandaimingii TaxID=2708079 RepID=UPI00141F443F|nr:ankyrin repeat domain-containing protein [Microbacterium fandaimingii]